MGYSKLFSEIIMSTIWREPHTVRILWITMLAIKDRWHTVSSSVPGLADAARISIDDCKKALKILSAPDPDSRTTDFEGRRIKKCDGGWVILNGEKYRNKMSIDERREYQRIKQKEYRDRKKEPRTLTFHPQSSQQFTHTDSDTDLKEKHYVGKKEISDLFEVIWKDYPVKDGKRQALRHFMASVKKPQDFSDIKKALMNYKTHLSLKANSFKKAKNGCTWFNNWRDWIDWQEPEERGSGPKEGDKQYEGGVFEIYKDGRWQRDREAGLKYL